jgi:hypothetical protein
MLYKITSTTGVGVLVAKAQRLWTVVGALNVDSPPQSSYLPSPPKDRDSDPYGSPSISMPLIAMITNESDFVAMRRYCHKYVPITTLFHCCNM